MIVPVHNPGKFIEACIDSLLGQSLARNQYEVIFVDDGSTDETPARLDDVASRESNVTVIHEPASGWPGRPRNIGIDRAVGAYVFFCDHDDWLGPEALERMVAYADTCGADILIGKTIGHRRGVPRDLFRANEPNATLWTKPLMTSLSPHKLFRRGFLDEHGLRFPEGKRRLEDHVLVVQAYFLATRIAVLSDYVCYHHIRRDDDLNAAYTPIDPQSYFGYVREVLDIIEAHTEPGPQRDHILERPFRQELLGRIARPRPVGTAPEGYDEAVFNEVRAVMLERFPPDFADRLPLIARVRAAIVRDDRYDLLAGLSARIGDLHGRVTMTSLHWAGSGWEARIEVEPEFSDGTPVRFIPRGDDRWSVDPRLLPADLQFAPDVGAVELLGIRPSVVVVERSSDEEWFAPSQLVAELHAIPDDPDSAHRVVVTGTADFDPATLAGGRPLANGIWDVAVRFSCIGVDLRGRVGVDPATRPALPSAAVIGPRPVTVIPYLTEGQEKLSLDVGQRVHTLLAALLARPIGPVSVTREHFSAQVDVDIAPGASPRSLRLQLLGGDEVVGHCEAAIVAAGDTATLRGGTVPKPAGGAMRRLHGPGRYTLGAQSRAKDEPSLVGTVDVNRFGRIIEADFSPDRRESVVPLPEGFGEVTPVDRAVERARHVAGRAVRGARRPAPRQPK